MKDDGWAQIPCVAKLPPGTNTEISAKRLFEFARSDEGQLLFAQRKAEYLQSFINYLDELKAEWDDDGQA